MDVIDDLPTGPPPVSRAARIGATALLLAGFGLAAAAAVVLRPAGGSDGALVVGPVTVAPTSTTAVTPTTSVAPVTTLTPVTTAVLATTAPPATTTAPLVTTVASRPVGPEGWWRSAVVATTTAGVLEVWTPAGRLATVDGCGGRPGCSVARAVVLRDAVPGVPACWVGDDTVAAGAWTPQPGADASGPIVASDVGGGGVLSTLDGSFAEVSDMVCRGDGAVALVRFASDDRSAGGDLIVVDRDSRSTRLGTGYATVLPLGSGPVALLDPATLPTPTSTVAPALSARAADSFAALTATGDLEVWTPAGKVRTIAVGVNDCSDLAKCGSPDKVDAVAITERSIWYGGSDGTLWRAALDGSAAPVSVSTAIAQRITDIAVSADDGVQWFVRDRTGGGDRLVPVLIRRERGVETAVAEGVVSVALSPDGRRLAYTRHAPVMPDDERLDGVGELVVVDLGGGATVRRPVQLVGDGVPFALRNLAWSPDGKRLLADDSWEANIKVVLDPSATGPIAQLDRPLGGRPLGCWTGASTVALANPRIPYADEPSLPGDVEALDLTGGQPLAYEVNVYSTSIACRSDRSVALVDGLGGTGELVVVRPGGLRTVLGRGYRSVLD